MSLSAAASVLVIFLLSLPVVSGQTDWGVTYSSHQICASKGSTVDIPCTYTYPPRRDELDTKVEETLWFTELNGNQSVDLRSEPDYSGRVEYLFKQNDCTLRIKDLRERDSAEYKFRFTTNHQGGSVPASPGVTLTVTDLQVRVKRSSGHEDQRSAAVYAPKTPSVSQSPSGEVMEGRSVTLSCSSDANPAANYTWYKETGSQLLSKGAQLVFSSIQSSDFGLYLCEAENQLGTDFQFISIKVKHAPKTPSVSVSPSGETVEGSSVTLSCSSDANPAASYTWFKEDVYKDLEPLGKGPEINFDSIQSSDFGKYFCEAENQLGRKRSEHINVHPYYAPRPPSVFMFPFDEIMEGISETLYCFSDANPAANYTWYKEDETQGHESIGKGPELIFKSIQSSDFGKYFCEAENHLGRKRSGYINVNPYYAPRRPSVLIFPFEIVEGSSVTLYCSSDANPAANYTWFKEDEDPPKASGEIFTITDFRPEHSGVYVCVAQNEKGHHNSTVHVTVVAGISTLTIHLIRLTLMLLLMTPLLPLTLWMRKKKKTLSSTTEPNESAEMMELDSDPQFEDVSAVSAAQTEDPEEQEDMV